MTSPLDFLNGADAPSADAPVISADPAPTPEIEAAAAPEGQGPLRDEKGRFAPVGQPEPAAPAPAEAAVPLAPTPVAPLAPPAPAQAAPAPQSASDPIADAIKAAEDRIKAEMEEKYGKQISGLTSTIGALRGEKRQQERQRPQLPSNPATWGPDDNAHLDTVVSTAVGAALQEQFDQRAEASYERLVAKIGQEQADEVVAWTRERSSLNPGFNELVVKSFDPLETAHAAFQQDPAQRVKSLEAKIAELSGQAPAAPAHAPNPQAAASAPVPQPLAAPLAPPPPTTIANATGAGGIAHVPQGPGQAYDALPFAKG